MADCAEEEAGQAAALQKEFGRRVRRRRMALGYQQPKLAAEAHIHQAHISRMERGLYRAMNLWTLAKLARALHTSVDYLLTLTDDAGDVPFEEGLLNAV